MSDIILGNCWSCGNPLTAACYGRGDVCSKCGRDTKTCRGCEFFDTSMNRSCREPQAELVLEKERSNFCDYFRPNRRGGNNASIAREKMKNSAEALFKKKQ